MSRGPVHQKMPWSLVHRAGTPVTRAHHPAIGATMQHRLRYPVMIILGIVGLAIGYVLSIASSAEPATYFRQKVSK